MNSIRVPWRAHSAAARRGATSSRLVPAKVEPTVRFRLRLTRPLLTGSSCIRSPATRR